MALGHTDIAVSNKLRLEKAQGASSWDEAGRSLSCTTDSIKETSTSLQLRGVREREPDGRACTTYMFESNI